MTENVVHRDQGKFINMHIIIQNINIFTLLENLKNMKFYLLSYKQFKFILYKAREN